MTDITTVPIIVASSQYDVLSANFENDINYSLHKILIRFHFLNSFAFTSALTLDFQHSFLVQYQWKVCAKWTEQMRKSVLKQSRRIETGQRDFPQIKNYCVFWSKRQTSTWFQCKFPSLIFLYLSYLDSTLMGAWQGFSFAV